MPTSKTVVWIVENDKALHLSRREIHAGGRCLPSEDGDPTWRGISIRFVRKGLRAILPCIQVMNGAKRGGESIAVQ